MAAAAPTFSQITQNHNNSNNTTITNIHEVNREEIQAAIAKAVELRALHAALMQRKIPSNLTYPSSSPVSHPVSQFSAQDYPVFTPSYEEVPLPGYRQFRMESGPLSGYWDCYELEGGNGDETILSDYKEEISSSKKGLPSCFVSLDSHICPAEDEKYVHGCSADDITVLQASPRTEFLRSSRRNSLGDFKSVSSYCNKCKPAIISSESDNAANNSKSSNIVVPLSDSHSSAQSHSKNRGMNFSWLFPRIKKKHKNENSPTRTESEEMSQISKDFGMMPIETLQKQLIEVNENRDAALMEVSEMRSSLGELKQKYECLETYCEDLKKALGQAAQANHLQVQERLGNPTRRGNSIDGHSGNLMPFSEEVMVECFLQIVSESRLSVKHFCKILVGQIEETDSTLMKNLDLVLQPHNLSLNSKYSKAVLYHLEAIISQQLYQDFENCVFQKNGSPKILDPQQERQAQCSSFVALRNLSWNEVLRKGTKYYSEEFSKFCDQKMSCIISTLNWTRPWPEQLLQAFFVAAKCIWLLHLLAFSFNPPLGILRVEENRSFDSNYMEDVFMDQQRSHGPTRVKIMVMPGFYVLDRVLRCKVLCKYKSVEIM